MANELSIVIRAKNLIAQGLQSAGASIRRFGAAIGTAVRRGAIVAAAAIAGLIATAKKLVEIYQVQARAESKLAAVQRATGFASGFTTNELKKQARELQTLTGIGDEVIINSQAILATFRNIRGDVFREATVALLDMQTVMAATGQEAAGLEEGAVRLGKALNDPVAGLSALSRVGVQFTEQQKRQVKAMQEAGDIAGAQRIILAELRGEFGGAAEGIDASTKAYMGLKAALGDTAEQFGAAITDVANLTEMFDLLTAALKRLQTSGAVDVWAVKVKKHIDDLSPAIAGLAKTVSAKVAGIEKAAGFAGAFSARGGFGKLLKGATMFSPVAAISASMGAVKGGEGTLGGLKVLATGYVATIKDGAAAWGELGATARMAKDDAHEATQAAKAEIAATVEGIQSARKAEEDAADAKDRTEMAAAQAKARAAADRKANLDDWMRGTKDEKARLAELADAERDRNALIARRTELMSQMQQEAGVAKAVAAIDADIQKLQAGIDKLMGVNIPERAAKRVADWAARRKEAAAVEADDAKRERKLAALRERERLRQPITKRGKEMLAQERAFKDAQKQAAQLKAQQDQLEKTRDAIQNQQLTELQGINATLAKNLQAP